MQTAFLPEQLDDPRMASSEKILRSCVHCGFCTATCPTYLLLGDELDSPRGRIYLIKDMLESGRPATREVVTHIDRCLSCLSCMTTCPSGVNYMHLVDHARLHIEKTYRRDLTDRLLRGLLAHVLPYRGRFRLALAAARLARPIRPLLARLPRIGARLSAMLALAPTRGPEPRVMAAPVVAAPSARVILLEGCAQPVLRPGINAAARRVLARLGVEVASVAGEGCCGALVHHFGREDDALSMARHNIEVWSKEIDRGGIDAILITTSGCGTVVKDYGFMFRDDPAMAAKAARISALTRDISEFLDERNVPGGHAPPLAVAYHAACSLQHGQQVKDAPKRLLRQAGFTVKDIPEGHICCGSAGTYNILQPELAGRLRDRKLGHIARLRPDVIATGNIGCMTQLATGAAVPVVHLVELLDWAQGGHAPPELASRAGAMFHR